MIGDALEADLVAARAEVESRMLDECEITRPGVKTWDESKGEWIFASVEVYKGKCRVRHRTVGDASVESGGQLIAVSETEIHIPALTVGVEVSDTVKITKCPTRPAQIGREFNLSWLMDGSQATALRYRVEAADAR